MRYIITVVVFQLMAFGHFWLRGLEFVRGPELAGHFLVGVLTSLFACSFLWLVEKLR